MIDRGKACVVICFWFVEVSILFWLLLTKALWASSLILLYGICSFICILILLVCLHVISS
jgi:hypothetical protein